MTDEIGPDCHYVQYRMFTHKNSLGLTEPCEPSLGIHTVAIPLVAVKEKRILDSVSKGIPSFYSQIQEVRVTTEDYEPPLELYNKLAPHIKMQDL